MNNIHQQLGETRSSYAHDHLLQTPDTFIPSVLPGMTNATAIVHAAPAMGADFAQYTALLQNDGTLGPAIGTRFLFVLEGSVVLHADKAYTLNASGFAVVPADFKHTVTASGEAKLAVIEKQYVALQGVDAPTLLVGSEIDIKPQPLLGDDDVQVRAMVPDSPSYDFAVNTMTYAPGAALSMTEVHVMEHGLLMLEGGGIYKLGERWYPVTAGDFIWMAPYCPQWFGALGKVPAKYLIFKDWARHPLTGTVR